MTSRRRYGETRAREMLAVGAALVSVAALLLGIGGVRGLAVSVGSIGILLIAVGAFLALTSRPEPSAQHVARLHGSAREIGELLERREAPHYGDGHRPREAFVAHFPEIGAAIEKWDGLFEVERELVSALNSTVADEVRSVAIKEWDSKTLDVDRLETLLFKKALECAREGRIDEPISLLDLAAAVDQSAHAGESATDRKARVDRASHEVKVLGDAAPKWQATVEVAECHERLQAFVQDEMPDLLERLKRIQECSPVFASGCPVCEPRTDRLWSIFKRHETIPGQRGQA